jgi:hypothetical protein
MEILPPPPELLPFPPSAVIEPFPINNATWILILPPEPPPPPAIEADPSEETDEFSSIYKLYDWI